MDDLKHTYPYITEEQWTLVNEGEAVYLDFLNDEDLKAHQDREVVEREQVVQAIINELKLTETSDEARLIIGGAQALQQFFFSQTGRYIGQDLMHQFVQYEPFRGLRIYTMSYETPEGVHGYNLELTFTHSSGLKFHRVIQGEGPNKENIEWQEITKN